MTDTWSCCGQPYGVQNDSCTITTVEIPTATKDEVYPSIPYTPEYGGPDQRCHDCNITRGSFHHPGCGMERCPKCEGQALSCGCFSDEAYDAWQRIKADLEAVSIAREQADQQNYRLRAALGEIRNEQGLVCPAFETCDHASCRSSHASWTIADAALEREKVP